MSRWFRLYDTVVDEPKVQRLSDPAFRAWINLMCVASRTGGVIPGDMRELGFRLRKPEARMRELVEQLRAAGLLDPLGADFEPHRWDIHQYKSDGSSERVKRFRERDKATHETGPESDSEKNRTDKAAQKLCFEEFWKICPRKVGRGAAEKSFSRALKLAEASVLMAAMTVYAAAQVGRDPTFICHPATWLNQQRWLDEGIAPPAPPDATVDADARAAWGGAAAKLVDEIGAASFQAYFGAAQFVPGPPVVLRIPKPHLRALVARKYSGALRRAFGEVEIAP